MSECNGADHTLISMPPPLISMTFLGLLIGLIVILMYMLIFELAMSIH